MHIDCDNRWYIKDLVNDITNQRSGDRDRCGWFLAHIALKISMKEERIKSSCLYFGIMKVDN